MTNNIEPNQKQTQHERILRWFDTHASLISFLCMRFNPPSAIILL